MEQPREPRRLSPPGGRLVVSLFPSLRSRHPRHALLDLWGLERLVRTPVDARSKEAVPLWSPARYRPRTTRAARNVVDLSAIVLDYDGGCAVEDALRPWRRWRAWWHTSWSHTPEKPRLRVVLPLAEPVPAEVWPRVWRRAQVLSAGLIDRTCKDPSRVWFLPARRPGGCYDCGGWGGSCVRIDLERLPPLPPPPAPVRPSRRVVPVEDADRARVDALRSDPALRERVGLALGGHLVESTSGSMIRHVPCPQCGRRDVWWPLAPRTRGGWARCNHARSCGWAGPLLELIP